METPVKRKVIDNSSSLRSANTPTPGHRPPAKAKVQVSSVAQVRSSRMNDRAASPAPTRARSPLKVRQDASRSVRSPSPVRMSATSSPTARVTSPELSTLGRASSQRVIKAKTSAFAISQRASPTARVIPATSPPSPYTRVNETISGGSPSETTAPASAFSLPASPALRLSPLPIGGLSNGGVTNLQPHLRGHLRTSSLSDTSSIGPHSPSSSSIGTGLYDGSSEIGLSSSRVGSVIGMSSNGSDNTNLSPTTSPIAGPSMRIKSKVSSLVISTSPPNGTSPTSPISNTLSFPSLHQHTLSRKSSLSSASASTPAPRPSVLNHRPRTPSTSSGISTPVLSQSSHARPHWQSSASGASTMRTSGASSKPLITNMHYSNYQPFPIPPLPAPPAPDVIGDVLHASPAPKSPPPTSGWPLPQSPPLYPPLRPRSGTATSDRSTRLGSTIDTPKHASSFAPLPSDINKDQSDARAEDDSSGQAEARSNRKIADLEITNRSLMSINMMLEATKVRQAKEIRDLRRRLRETRLVLPPRAFAALRSSDASSVAPDVDVAGAENDGEDDEDSDVAEGEVDQIYDRVSGMIERMLGHAKEAVERVEKREEVREGMVKVLSAAEVAGEVYHDAVEDDNKDDPETDFEDEGTSFNTGRESVDGGAEKMGTEASDQETEESDNGSEAEVEDLIEGGRESFVSAQSHLSLITDLGPHPGTEGSPTTLPSSTPRRSLPSLPLLTITAGTPIQSTRPTFPPPIST